MKNLKKTAIVLYFGCTLVMALTCVALFFMAIISKEAWLVLVNIAALIWFMWMILYETKWEILRELRQR